MSWRQAPAFQVVSLLFVERQPAIASPRAQENLEHRIATMGESSAEQQIFRFVGQYGTHRSAEWIIRVAGSSSDDVYLSTRMNFGSLKVSLHASGYCQHGLTAPVRPQVPPDRRGAFDRWSMEPPAPGTSRLAYRVILPGSELHEYPKPLHAKTYPFYLASAENQLNVDVCFTAPPFSVEDWYPEGSLAARYNLGSGAVLDVRCTETPIDWGLVIEAIAITSTGDSRSLPPTAYRGRAGYAFGVDPILGVRFAMEMHPRHDRQGRPGRASGR